MNTAWIEVERLVRLAQAGDREAFGELVERFQGSVFAVARRRNRDVHEAAELVQEVFMHALRKIGQLREPACFGAWLQRITVRIAINRATRRPPLPTAGAEILEQGPAREENPLEDLVRSERREQVRSAVAGLRPLDRDALVAFYMKGKSLAEIADEFDVPIGTVKRRLHVARHRLQESLEQAGSTVANLPPARQPRSTWDAEEEGNAELIPMRPRERMRRRKPELVAV
ncbi:MAG: sigma-70 family RNA polymerase sigma factor [Planctomycetota bacterium]